MLDLSLLDAAGVPSPAVALPQPDLPLTVWCKLELVLPSGSTKDRIAGAILRDGIARGVIGPDTVVVEASSGSTSISLAMACAQVGLRFVAVMPEGGSAGRLLIIRRYGGETGLTPAARGVPGAIERARQMAADDPAVHLSDQFNNPVNALAHEQTTGPELLAQVPEVVHGFVAAVGTGGTLMGVGRALRAQHPDPAIARVRVADQPADAEQGALPCGIPGVVDCLSGLLDPVGLGLHDDVPVGRADALATTRALCRRGIGAGPSSGLNVAGARALARRLLDRPAAPAPLHVAPVACARRERSFPPDLFAALRDPPRS